MPPLNSFLATTFTNFPQSCLENYEKSSTLPFTNPDKDQTNKKLPAQLFFTV